VVDAVNTNRVQTPASVEGCNKGTSHCFKIVSNEEWKEYA
jgi:hypothetical protein